MRTNKSFDTFRLKNLFWLVFIFAGLIAFKMIDIQLISHKKYTEAAEQNRTQILYQTAPRGRIFASGGEVLATNSPAFSLYFLPSTQEFSPSDLNAVSQDVAKYLGAKQEDISDKLKKALKSGKAVALAQNISPQKVFSFAELQIFYPGLYLLEESKRTYPNGSFLAHLLGYMGPMDNKAWRKFSQSDDYRLNSKIGKSGIEKRYEHELKGRDGGLFLEVDYKGRVKQKIKDNKGRAGEDIYTTINYAVQKAAEEGIKNSSTGQGAVVVMNPKTGALLAMVSAPDFDPNIFVPYDDQQIIGQDKATIPEYNLALQGLYPPASPFKIITSIAAYETGRLDVEEKLNCKGKMYLNGREFKDWKAHGEDIDFFRGMAQSCDIYFYNLGLKVGPSHIERIERLFRFDRQTGIDLPGEKSGNIYGPSKRARLRTYWFGGDTLNLSIGQGELLLTPLQMAVFGSTLANKGKIWKPYYIERIVSPEGQVTFQGTAELVSELNFKPGLFELLHKALKGVVDTATGYNAHVDGFDIYGKTGTAQNPHGEDHGWFMGFAARPGQEPDLALAVFVEFGKGGASAAAPIAREIIKAYYGVK